MFITFAADQLNKWDSRWMYVSLELPQVRNTAKAKKIFHPKNEKDIKMIKEKERQ